MMSLFFDPRRVQECKDDIQEYIDIFTPIGPSDFVKIDPIVFEMKDDSLIVGKPKFFKTVTSS